MGDRRHRYNKLAVPNKSKMHNGWHHFVPAVVASKARFRA